MLWQLGVDCCARRIRCLSGRLLFCSWLMQGHQLREKLCAPTRQAYVGGRSLGSPKYYHWPPVLSLLPGSCAEPTSAGSQKVVSSYWSWRQGYQVKRYQWYSSASGSPDNFVACMQCWQWKKQTQKDGSMRLVKPQKCQRHLGSHQRLIICWWARIWGSKGSKFICSMLKHLQGQGTEVCRPCKLLKFAGPVNCASVSLIHSVSAMPYDQTLSLMLILDLQSSKTDTAGHCAELWSVCFSKIVDTGDFAA